MKKYREFISQYLSAYAHKGGAKVVALGQIDHEWFAQIQREAISIIDNQPSSDVAAKDHTTNWTKPKGKARQFSLYNATGKSDEYLSDFAPSKTTPKQLVFPRLTGLKRFAELFGADLVNLRLNGLGSSSGLSLHEENPITVTPFGREYRARFHLPIFTNENAKMLLDGEEFHFNAGNLYFFNHGCVHAAVNDSDSPRYHLVLDCELTPELFARLFVGPASPYSGDGLHRFDAQASAEQSKGAQIHFGEFVTEAGVTMNEINYGRRVPTATDWYRTNYPSLFRPLDRLFGEKSLANR